MSKRHLDQLVVVDLEATCWETELETKQNTSEIIEIGVCFYNIDSGRAWKVSCPKCQGVAGNDCLICQSTGFVTSIIVKPEVSKISDFCTNLTSITPELIKKYGLDFASACNRLRKFYGPKNRIWASWGDYDRRMFSDHCKQRGVDYPFSATHWNVKSIHGVMKKLKREVGLGKAIEMADLEFEGKAHRGGDDAYNTARVIAELSCKW